MAAEKADQPAPASGTNKLVFIKLVGAVVALVVVVGSMFYMERKTGAKRRRALEEPLDWEMEAYTILATCNTRRIKGNT